MTPRKANGATSAVCDLIAGIIQQSKKRATAGAQPTRAAMTKERGNAARARSHRIVGTANATEASNTHGRSHVNN